MNKLTKLLLALVLTFIPLSIFANLLTMAVRSIFFSFPQILALFVFEIVAFLVIYICLNKISGYFEARRETFVVKILRVVVIVLGILTLCYMFISVGSTFFPAS